MWFLNLPFSFYPSLALVGFIFWIWALYECLTKESSEGNDKLVWVLVILLTPIVGALIYTLVRRPERIRTLGH